MQFGAFALHFFYSFCRIRILKAKASVQRFGGVAQLGERCVRNAEVRSSILLISTI